MLSSIKISLAAFFVTSLGSTAFGYTPTNEPQIAGLSVDFDDPANDYKVNHGAFADGVWTFASASPAVTPGCAIETVPFPDFGSSATTNGHLRASVNFPHYAWFGNEQNYNNSLLFSIFIVYTDAAGTQHRTPYLEPVHYVQKSRDFAGTIYADENNWTVTTDLVNFQGEISNVKVQVCMINGTSVVNMKNIVLELSDG